MEFGNLRTTLKFSPFVFGGFHRLREMSVSDLKFFESDCQPASIPSLLLPL